MILGSAHYHAKDLIERLKEAEKKGYPVYPAQGLCGGCDLIIADKKDPLDVSALIKSLEGAAKDNLPLYTVDGPCGACDVPLPPPFIKIPS